MAANRAQWVGKVIMELHKECDWIMICTFAVSAASLTSKHQI